MANGMRLEARPATIKPRPSAIAPQTMGGTMPKRSDSRPITTPPQAKPSMVSVKGSEASARATPNSACTVGSTTGTDHMPTLPTVVSATATASRRQASGDSTPALVVPGMSILVAAFGRFLVVLTLGSYRADLPCQLHDNRATP